MNQKLYSLAQESFDHSIVTERIRRLIISSMEYNALMSPGRSIEYRIYMGEKWQYPCLTDFSTLNGGLTDAEGLRPFYSAKVTSLVKSQSKFSPHFFGGVEQIVDRNIRYVLITPDDATDADVEMHNPLSSKQEIYRNLEACCPVAFDDFREIQRQRRWNRGLGPVDQFEVPDLAKINQEQTTHHPYLEIAPGAVRHGAEKAVIIGMHWLQAGGAERWAVETVRLVREAGMLPIVITDRPSHQPWIDRPEFKDALVLCLTFPIQERPGDEPLLRSLVEQFDIRGVLVHHCQWLYDRLWWIKKYRPNATVVDSLHIVEYPYGGGYPNQAVSRDMFIDLHHVISPQLVSWLVDSHGVDANKVIDAPLVGLTADRAAKACKESVSKGKLTVCFVGRISRQKRPEAFVLLAKKLDKCAPGRFRFIMHGNGDLDPMVDKIIARHGLSDVIERRGMQIPVDKTYSDSDVLVVSAINEGITLTTIESLSAGLPVVSTDVGSQNTLIPTEALTPRSTRDFIKCASRILLKMLEDDDFRKSVWQSEMDRLVEFSKLKNANTLFTEILGKWSEDER